MTRHNFLSSALALILASPSAALALAPIPGEQELHRFASPSVFDSVLPIIVTRNNRLTTGVRLTTNSQDDYLLEYAPGGVVIQKVIPDQDRLLQMSASNWGSAITVDQNGGTPMVSYAAPFGQPLQEIFRGTPNGSHSEPSVSDIGTVAFTGRVTNSHGKRDVWVWTPGGTAQLLPDLGEDDLGDFAFVDGQKAVITTHRFVTPQFYTGLFRYDSATGWTDLAQGLSEQPAQTGGAFGKTSNLPGDVVFLTGGSTSYTLRLYSNSNGTIVPIADATRSLFGGQVGTRDIVVSLADTGEVLAIIGGTSPQDAAIDVLFRTPDGNAIDLESLLPAGESLSAYPTRPAITMSHLGRLLIESRNDSTGRWSYHYYDRLSNTFLSPGPIQSLDLRLGSTALSDDGRIYYWRDEGAETALFTLPVPEPNSFAPTVVAALVAVCGQRGAGNRKRLDAARSE